MRSIDKTNGNVKPGATTLLDAALSYRMAGLAPFPAIRAVKNPNLKGWSQNHAGNPAPADHLAQLYASGRYDALCLIMGHGFEAVDFDDASTLEEYGHAVRARRPELAGKIVFQRTPSGGGHVVIRATPGVEIPANQKLARRRVDVPGAGLYKLGKDGRAAQVETKQGHQHVQEAQKDRRGWFITPTVIETRGKGGLILCAPTPGYKLVRGDFTNMAVITAEERDWLLDLARSFDEMDTKAVPEKLTTESDYEPDILGKVGDRFSARTPATRVLDWLIRAGWSYHGESEDNYQITRPGKDEGVSATVRKSGVPLFHCFTSSVPNFEENETLPPWRLLARLYFNDDFAATAKYLHGREQGEIKQAVEDGPPPQAAESTTPSVLSRIEIRDPYAVRPEDIRCTDAGLTKPPAREALLGGEGALYKDIVAVIAGQGGSAKSTTFGIQAGVGLATGKDLTGGLFTIPKKKHVVLNVSAEDDRAEGDRAIFNLRQVYGDLDLSNYYRIPATGGSFALLKRDSAQNLVPTREFESLVRLVQEIKPDLTILDPVSDFAGPASIDSSNQDAVAFLALLNLLRAESGGGTVLGVHHVSKLSLSAKSGGAAKKSAKTVAEVMNRLEPALSVSAVRGASALSDKARWAATMTIVPQSCFKALGVGRKAHVVALSVPKSNYGPRRDIAFLERTPEGLFLPFEPLGVTEMRDPEYKAAIVQIIQQNGKAWTKHGLAESLKGDPVLPGRDEVVRLINEMLADGALTSKPGGPGGGYLLGVPETSRPGSGNSKTSGK